MTETILDKIILETRSKVAMRTREDRDKTRLRALEIRATTEPFRLSKVLRRRDRANVIAEIKRASPSKGVINDQIDVADTAKMYERGGACAISVLTEEKYFNGSVDDLKAARAAVELPILRKDFIVDEYQIFEAAALGADAVLLIVAALSKQTLAEFQQLANDLGIDALVEVHTLEELETANDIQATLIGVNNRNLKTFEVSLDVSRMLITHRPENALMVAESGLKYRHEIDELRSLGFDGFLVGESLMRATNSSKLHELLV